ncbi:hypothetical protein BCV70DRAFT_200843 [Testicularia cyperi]|uniref:protein-tyrosine-phosphatase n=1 Tax=Testicularia cyperi TaxID=1882483 RepID=A0A317XMG2_9BASI|nr:hypothetical protein BCV70DRAFT_200843 [Testicularia cyperi]
MDEVVPGLWVGGLRAAMDKEYLSQAGVTHIITCMKQRLPVPSTLPDGRKITEKEMKQVRLDDDEKAPILVHFASCNEFISNALEEEWVPDEDQDEDQDSSAQDGATPPSTDSPASDRKVAGDVDLLVQGRQKRDGKWGHWQTTGTGTVLVHCQAGCSRSVAVVAAYLMSTRHITAHEAVEMIRLRRKDAQPNAGFMAQLELYHQVGFEIDMRFQAVRRFLMSKTDILNGDSMDDMLLSYYPSPYPSPALSSAIKGLTPFSPPDASDSTSLSPTRETTSSQLLRKNSNARPHHHDQKRDDSPPTDSALSATTSLSLPQPAFASTSQPLIASPEPLSESSSSNKVAQLGSHFASMDTASSSAPATGSSSSQSSLGQTNEEKRKTTIDEAGEVKVTANSGRLPGGVSNIRGHEGANNRGSLPRPTFTGPKLRCRSCRRELAAFDHVVIHEPGKGQMAFEHRKRDTGHGNSTVASDTAGNISSLQKFGARQSRDDAMTSSQDHSNTAATSEPVTEQSQTTQAAPPSSSAQTPVSASATASESVLHQKAPDTPEAATLQQQAQTQPQRRQIQSAASLASRLPPHLAALRGGGAARARAPAPAPAPASVPASTSSVPSVPSSAVSSGRVTSPDTTASASTSASGSARGWTDANPSSAVGMSARSMLHSSACSSYFIEPMAWMSALSDGEVTGRLNCPNAKCEHKLGSWDWAGMQCGCGAWVTPAFALHRSKVDEI